MRHSTQLILVLVCSVALSERAQATTFTYDLKSTTGTCTQVFGVEPGDWDCSAGYSLWNSPSFASTENNLASSNTNMQVGDDRCSYQLLCNAFDFATQLADSSWDTQAVTRVSSVALARGSGGTLISELQEYDSTGAEVGTSTTVPPMSSTYAELTANANVMWTVADIKSSSVGASYIVQGFGAASSSYFDIDVDHLAVVARVTCDVTVTEDTVYATEGQAVLLQGTFCIVSDIGESTLCSFSDGTTTQTSPAIVLTNSVTCSAVPDFGSGQVDLTVTVSQDSGASYTTESITVKYNQTPGTDDGDSGGDKQSPSKGGLSDTAIAIIAIASFLVVSGAILSFAVLRSPRLQAQEGAGKRAFADEFKDTSKAKGAPVYVAAATAAAGVGVGVGGAAAAGTRKTSGRKASGSNASGGKRSRGSRASGGRSRKRSSMTSSGTLPPPPSDSRGHRRKHDRTTQASQLTRV